MSPTVLRYKSYRFFFFSREERRVHVHVIGPDGEAKFWLEPVVALVHHDGLSVKQLKELHQVVERKRNGIIRSWHKHFAG